METYIAAIISGLLATSITLVVTHIQGKKQEKKNFKMLLFREMVAYRTDILPNAISSGNFTKAVNQVFIAYNDCPAVMKAFEEFRKNVIYRTNGNADNAKIIDSLVLLLKTMADDLKIDYSFSNDDLFTRPIVVGK